MSAALSMISENKMAQSSVITIKPHEEFVLVTVECAMMEDDHAQAMQTEVAEAAEGTPNLPVVLDMSQVKMLPSISIGAIVTLWQKFKQDNRKFIIIGLCEKIREMLTVCRLDKLFELCENVDDALLRIRQSS